MQKNENGVLNPYYKISFSIVDGYIHAEPLIVHSHRYIVARLTVGVFLVLWVVAYAFVRP